MKSSSPCSCHTSALDPCDHGVLELPLYYARQILTPVDLTLEQKYFRDKMRRHNRLLHGWGVVCGALVCLVPEDKEPKPTDTGAPGARQPQPWKVRVTSGYVLGPYGDEILIDCERVIDLRTVGVEGECGEGHGHGEPADPWCAEVFVKREPGPLWLAVRYKEQRSRPVRVEAAGCGCEDSQCEYSRLRDGYEIGVLTCCPPSHANPPGIDDLFHGPAPGCPDCPADPWVVLARVEMDPDGAIRAIDNCSCRRIVISFATSWWRCEGDSCAIESVEVKDGVPVEPGATFTLAVKTRLLAPANPQARLGEGVDFIAPARVTANLLEANFTVRPDAKPGPRTLEILDDKNNVVAAWANAVTVQPKQGAAPPPPAPPAEPVNPPKPQPRKGKGGNQ
jgi:hypothetical protein